MKVLVVATPAKLKHTRHVWRALAKFSEVHHALLGEGQPWSGLRQLAVRHSFEAYDRVIVDHSLRRMGRHYRFLKRIPNLVLFECDFCQNYLPEGGCPGRLEAMLRTLNEHRVIVTSVYTRDKLIANGFDAAYCPKGYDSSQVYDLGSRRDIEIGFIGRTKHRAYSLRRAVLDRLSADVGLKSLRTEENSEYNQALNRIQIFVSPDLGYHELMIKNFEALAAGCVLVTARPEPAEVDQLGLVDFENVVMYDNYDELLDKVRRLQRAPELVSRIAAAGRELARSRHDWESRAEVVFQQLHAPLRRPPPPTWRDWWRLLPVCRRGER
jgi:glycosyltransferase involved in cell wall biosynthesis